VKSAAELAGHPRAHEREEPAIEETRVAQLELELDLRGAALRCEAPCDARLSAVSKLSPSPHLLGGGTEEPRACCSPDPERASEHQQRLAGPIDRIPERGDLDRVVTKVPVVVEVRQEVRQRWRSGGHRSGDS